MEVKRGAIVVAAAKGAYTGKPRPALIVQSDLFNPTHQNVPGARTGLRVVSQIMADKIVSIPRSAITAEIGRCDAAELEAAEDALRRWLGLD